MKDGHFWAAHGWGGAKAPLPSPKICHTYPTIMKFGTITPYLKKMQKTYESRDTHPEFCWHHHFLPEISKFCSIKKYSYKLHIGTYFLMLLTVLEYLKIISINLVIILMVSAKMATPGLLKIEVFWKKRLWRHDFCPWHRQQNFITWFKLMCKCGHVIKVW